MNVPGVGCGGWRGACVPSASERLGAVGWEKRCQQSPPSVPALPGCCCQGRGGRGGHRTACSVVPEPGSIFPRLLSWKLRFAQGSLSSELGGHKGGRVLHHRIRLVWLGQDLQRSSSPNALHLHLDLPPCLALLPADPSDMARPRCPAAPARPSLVPSSLCSTAGDGASAECWCQRGPWAGDHG